MYFYSIIFYNIRNIYLYIYSNKLLVHVHKMCFFLYFIRVYSALECVLALILLIFDN